MMHVCLIAIISLVVRVSLGQPDSFSVSNGMLTPPYAVTTLTDRMVILNVGSMISKELEVTSGTIDKAFELLKIQDAMPKNMKDPCEGVDVWRGAATGTISQECWNKIYEIRDEVIAPTQVSLYDRIPREKIKNVINTIKLKMSDPGSKDKWHNEYVEVTTNGMKGHIMAINSHILAGGKCKITINGLSIIGSVPKLYSAIRYDRSSVDRFLGIKIGRNHDTGLDYKKRELTSGELSMIDTKLRNRMKEVSPSLITKSS